MPVSKYIKPKAVILMEALLMGLEINYDGRIYLLDVKNELCIRAANDRDKLLKIGFGGTTLTEFISWAERMPESRMLVIQGDMALNKMRHEKR